MELSAEFQRALEAEVARLSEQRAARQVEQSPGIEMAYGKIVKNLQAIAGLLSKLDDRLSRVEKQTKKIARISTGAQQDKVAGVLGVIGQMKSDIRNAAIRAGRLR